MSIKIILFTPLLFFLTLGYSNNTLKKADPPSMQLTGIIQGIDSGKVSFNDKEYEIRKGQFKITYHLKTPVFIHLTLNNKYSFSFFAENSDITIALDTANSKEANMGGMKILKPKVSGSKVNLEYEKVAGYLASTPESKKLTKLYQKSLSLKPDTKKYKRVEEKLSKARDQSRKRRTSYIKDYALNHPDSFVAAYYMQFQNNEVDQTFEEYKKIVQGFSDEVKKSSYYKTLKDEFERIKKVAVGRVAPDFTLKTNEGEDFTLSSLRNKKIVLIDFWASWCVPCRKAFPALKKVYQKYHAQGFEIVGVTNDSNHEQWKKAISDDKLPWIQVADVFPPRDQGPPFTAKVITEYAAPYLPSSYLLDKDGKIIAKHLTAKELDKKLSTLLKKK